MLIVVTIYVCICWTPAVSVTWSLMVRHLSLLSHWGSAAQTLNGNNYSAGSRPNIKGIPGLGKIVPEGSVHTPKHITFVFHITQKKISAQLHERSLDGVIRL